MDKKIKVFIAEDSPNVRNNIKKVISKTPKLQTIGEADNITDAIESFNKLLPDLVIIDIGLTNSSGIDLLKHIKGNNYSVKTLVFTNYVSPPYKIICDKLGADFFLDKTKDFDKLVEILNNYQM